MNKILCALLLFSINYSFSQEVKNENITPSEVNSETEKPENKKPVIEDNSFFIEEAHNQEAGVVQFINSCIIEPGKLTYNFANEIPLRGTKHQISYAISYASVSDSGINTHGFKELMLNYRYELLGEDKLVQCTPRISLIVPTGNMGEDAWGGQTNVSFSKDISHCFVVHANLGATYKSTVKKTIFDIYDNRIHIVKRNLYSYNVGASSIFMVRRNFHLMLEGVENFTSEINEEGKVEHIAQTILSPGFRIAFDIGNAQIVPGFCLPLTFSNEKPGTAAFFYLSIETDFNKK